MPRKKTPTNGAAIAPQSSKSRVLLDEIAEPLISTFTKNPWGALLLGKQNWDVIYEQVAVCCDSDSAVVDSRFINEAKALEFVEKLPKDGIYFTNIEKAKQLFLQFLRHGYANATEQLFARGIIHLPLCFNKSEHVFSAANIEFARKNRTHEITSIEAMLVYGLEDLAARKFLPLISASADRRSLIHLLCIAYLYNRSLFVQQLFFVYPNLSKVFQDNCPIEFKKDMQQWLNSIDYIMLDVNIVGRFFARIGVVVAKVWRAMQRSGDDKTTSGQFNVLVGAKEVGFLGGRYKRLYKAPFAIYDLGPAAFKDLRKTIANRVATLEKQHGGVKQLINKLASLPPALLFEGLDSSSELIIGCKLRLMSNNASNCSHVLRITPVIYSIVTNNEALFFKLFLPLPKEPKDPMVALTYFVLAYKFERYAIASALLKAYPWLPSFGGSKAQNIALRLNSIKKESAEQNYGDDLLSRVQCSDEVNHIACERRLADMRLRAPDAKDPVLECIYGMEIVASSLTRESSQEQVQTKVLPKEVDDGVLEEKTTPDPLAIAQEQLAKAYEKNAKLVGKNKQLQTDNQQLQQKLSCAEQTRNEALHKHEALYNESEAKRVGFLQEIKQLKRRLAMVNEDARIRLQQLELQLHEQTDQIVELEKANDQLEKKVVKAGELQSDRLQLMADLAAKNNELIKAREQISVLVDKLRKIGEQNYLLRQRIGKLQKAQVASKKEPLEVVAVQKREKPVQKLSSVVPQTEEQKDLSKEHKALLEKNQKLQNELVHMSSLAVDTYTHMMSFAFCLQEITAKLWAENEGGRNVQYIASINYLVAVVPGIQASFAQLPRIGSLPFRDHAVNFEGSADDSAVSGPEVDSGPV